ncbi:MAG: hypothetical protein O2780_09515 [Proteobacteria bacterium]|nr:hypothetical protein [Pseudomonadota bacterium]
MKALSLLKVRNVVKATGIAVLVWTTFGCSTSPAPTSPAIEPASTSTLPEPPDPRIASLLHQGREALARDHLTTPLDSNAYLRFLQVLSIDPTNADALVGLADIVERYLQWAVTHARQGDTRAAVDYLTKARSVDETHPNVEPVAALISRLSETRNVHHRIDLTRDPVELDAQFVELARTIDHLSASVVIRASSDQDGRWIYQQLNAATSDRLRATFEAGNPTEVVLLY